MKPVDVKSNTYINYCQEIKNEDPKLKVGDQVRILKCENIFVKGYLPNWSEEVFVILTVKKLLENFTKTNCKKQIKKS